MSDPLLTPEDVADIVAVLDSSGYHTLDIATARYRLKIRRDEGAGAGWSQEWEWAGGVAAAVAAPAAAQHVTPDGLTAVLAPLPGTFYRAPSPGAPPFVELGAHVTADTVVGIVETMKLMNPVHAGVAGEVVAIIAENATMVENGAAILHVRAHGPGTS